MVTESFDELQKLFDRLESGPQEHRDASLYSHSLMKFAFERIAELESPQNYQQVVDQIQRLCTWLKQNGHAHYVCIDTRKENDDGQGIAMIVHALEEEKQFNALHWFVEQSKNNLIRNMEPL